jgi:exodeoxyribonuclease VII large subunit
MSLGAHREDMARLSASLDALSPLKVLGRGYSIAYGPRGVVKSKKDVKSGETLKLKVSDGDISCIVKE